MRTIDGMLFVAGLGLIPYAIPAMMPSWRWLLLVVIVLGGPLAAIWIQDTIVTSDPDYKGSPGDALGLVFFLPIAFGFFIGVGVRVFTLALAALSVPLRHIVTILIIGFTIVPAVFGIPSAWQDWKRRPPSEACTDAVFDITIAKSEFRIPVEGNFSFYLGKTVAKNAYYLSNNESLRAFCSLNTNGAKKTKATIVSFMGTNYSRDAGTLCKNSVADWAASYCLAKERSRTEKPDSIVFPHRIHLFSPSESQPGDFGGSPSTYDDWLKAPAQTRGLTFFTSGNLTPDNKPLTFRCQESSQGYWWCHVSYLWRNGTHLHYAFSANSEDVIARGEQIDRETRSFVSRFSIN